MFVCNLKRSYFCNATVSKNEGNLPNKREKFRESFKLRRKNLLQAICQLIIADSEHDPDTADGPQQEGHGGVQDLHHHQHHHYGSQPGSEAQVQVQVRAWGTNTTQKWTVFLVNTSM